VSVALASSILVTATLDGSSACLSQTAIAALFTITAPTSASLTLHGVTVATTLRSNGVLDFSNSLYPTNCVTRADRTSNSPTPAISGGAGGTTPAPANGTINPSAILGTWYSDSSACSPSPSCCCVTGPVTVAPNTTAVNTVDVTVTLAGVQYSCYQLDTGAITLPFILLNYSYAYYSPPGMPFIRFEAVSNAAYTRIVISNTVERNCNSAIYRSVQSGVIGTFGQNAVAATMTMAALASGWALAAFG
jgi:hypothetical protein